MCICMPTYQAKSHELLLIANQSVAILVASKMTRTNDLFLDFGDIGVAVDQQLRFTTLQYICCSHQSRLGSITVRSSCSLPVLYLQRRKRNDGPMLY